MPASSGDHARILVAANDPPASLADYRLVRNHLELERVLKRDASSLQLAVVFSDFDLTPEQAIVISDLLPYILVDRWQGGERLPELPGIGTLLGRLSYLDRLVVVEESRWEQWRSQYRLPPVNREPTPEAGHIGGLETFIRPEMPDLPVRDAPPFTAEEADSPPRGARFGLDPRLMKLMHLTEAGVVGGFLDDLGRDMFDTSRLSLLEFIPRNGRWCHVLRDRLRYLAACDDDHIIKQFAHDFPDQRCQSLTELLRARGDETFDLLLAVDAVNLGSEADGARLEALLSLACDGTRLLILENFGAAVDGAEPRPGMMGLSIRAFEERLWEASRGRLLLDRCEILRYPFSSSPATRALLQLQWLGGR